MFREMHDDQIGAWGWPWHGLVDSVDGLHHPQQVVPFERIYGGVCTTLFDIGRSAVETPAEVAAMGGELWSQAILRWSLTSSQNWGNTPGFNLPGFPITAVVAGERRVVCWLGAVQISSPGSALRFSGQLYRLENFTTGTAFAWDFPRAECGQGAEQPSIEVFSTSSTSTQAVLGTTLVNYTGQVLDVRDNRLLFGITVGAFGNVASANYPERPRLLIGLLELVVDYDAESGALTPSVNVLLDRAAALGTRTISAGGAEVNGNLLAWPEPTITDTRTDWPSCGGSYIEEAPGGMVETGLGPSGFLFDRVDNRHRTYSIQGGLLCARYNAAGAVETAHYDAEYSYERDLARSHTNHGHIYLEIARSPAEVGEACQETETAELDSYVIFDEHERSRMQIRHAIYGYGGALVDERNYEGVTNWSRLYKHHRTPELSETLESEPYTHVFSLNGEVVASIELPADTAPTQRRLYQDAPSMRGQGLLTSTAAGTLLHAYPESNHLAAESAIWPLSNHMACLVRRSATGSDSTTLTAGPALTPGGVDAGSYSYAGGWTGAQRDVFLSGAYNPVTGEVARCDPTRQFSWA